MTQSFDEWMNENHGGLFDMPHQRECFEAGAQSRQAEVDALNEKHSEEKRILHNVIEMSQAKIDELQARIDKAVEILESDAIGFTGLIQNYDKAESILKGNKDEN